MKRSTHRILTTHVGSLARPDSLIPILRSKERGQPYDAGDFARLAREAVADAVRKQVEAGIDVVADGELRRDTWVPTVHALAGFEMVLGGPGWQWKGSDRADEAGPTSQLAPRRHSACGKASGVINGPALLVGAGAPPADEACSTGKPCAPA